jgi:hypothetical protein
LSSPESEQDVQQDPATAGARDEGGDAGVPGGDRQSTTGATPNEDFVGRVAGDDSYAEETGAEARAEQDRRSAEEQAMHIEGEPG